MKKSLLALAVLGAFAGVAQAQTSVTIYGSIDGGVRYVNHANATTGVVPAGASATGGKKFSVSSTGTYNSNRLGFKGVEDLGGGMNAHFTLENGFNIGTGTMDSTVANQLFNRTAAVGIGGGWGSIDIGRQYSIAFKTVTAIDPFNSKYTGIDPLTSIAAGNQATATNPVGFGSARFNNDIQYTGVFGPVTARAEYALGEVTGATSTGSSSALGAMYANGPLTFGGAYTTRKTNGVAPAAAPAAAALSSITTFTTGGFTNKQWTLGGAYTFGPARIAAGYMDEKQDLATALGVATGSEYRAKNAWVGGSYAITPAFELSAGYFNTKLSNTTAGAIDGKRQLFMFGATYALSKRTNFYAEIDTSKYSDSALGLYAGTAAATATTSAIDRVNGASVGINHVF